LLFYRHDTFPTQTGNKLSWLESRTCEINQRVAGSTPIAIGAAGGVLKIKGLQKGSSFLFSASVISSTQMGNYSVYILFSQKLNRFYVGTTDDVERRLQEHNEGTYKDAFTSKGIPWVNF
jgi:hypothetical protein